MVLDCLENFIFGHYINDSKTKKFFKSSFITLLLLGLIAGALFLYLKWEPRPKEVKKEEPKEEEEEEEGIKVEVVDPKMSSHSEVHHLYGFK